MIKRVYRFLAGKDAIHVRLWDAPFNGGWVWFNWRRWRFEWGREEGIKWWWAIGPTCGTFTIQNAPWRRR